MARTYYRGPDAVVTSDRFVWLAQPECTFALRELHRAGVVRAAPSASAGVRAVVAASLVAAVAAVGVAVAVRATWMWAVAGAVVVVAAGVGWGGWRRRAHRWEIHASYRGADVVVYASADERVFHQVARALGRSIESQSAR
ncbi:hypothetical protein Ade02nite_17950 [Paractinoplanes deccanensis]|uniref:Uncharacterized protein n=1 Tax=Paractinoplanes deccanensis TaxID=113561 RepID=A0ABQ3XZK7_9ACTN|nr:DUF6232 family protein [Actinoplanes deccanensis]GID73154.1 hypothetical protein Ade02nite_17950 [Actinoplanes deccanensis]